MITLDVNDIFYPVFSGLTPFFKYQDSPDTVRLLSVAISIFGPQMIVQEVFIKNKGHYSSQVSYDGNKVGEAEDFMQIFKNIFVPWCLQSNSCSTSARLDLLLALLDDEYFSEQWSFIVNYVIGQGYSDFEPRLPDADHAAIMAMLLEKARDESMKRKAKDDSSHSPGTNAEDWHHEYLESSAIAVCQSLPPLNNSHVQFVWYVNLKFQQQDEVMACLIY